MSIFRASTESGTNQTFSASQRAAAKQGSKEAARGARSARSGNIVATTVPPRPGKAARARAL